MKKLLILHDTESAVAVIPVQRALTDLYKLETVEVLHQAAETVETAFSRSRKQYNASKLLAALIQNMARVSAARDAVALWMVRDDLYVAGMNFVFGLAHTGKAAVLSIHRLYSEELIVKEAIHELGHVFGLPHCTNECVMQYSNSLAEAETKPARLCERCRAHISYL
ncbi:MAG: peptidase [Candidatus Methanospirareceae archaeon]